MARLDGEIRARVSMYVAAPPETVYAAFVQPAQLTRFWLGAASGPLRIGEPVRWNFLVEGAEVDTTATVMADGRQLEWEWSDGSRVSILFEALDGGTVVTLVNDRLTGTGDDLVAAALDATEGFALVLADLKTLLESGTSAGIVAAKAKLIQLKN